MSKKNIIRAWRNPEYRKNLSRKARASLPDNPAGYIELKDEDLAMVAAASSLPECTGYINTCDAQCYTELATCAGQSTCGGATCGATCNTCYGPTCVSTGNPCKTCM